MKNPFPNVFAAYNKIQELKQEFPNDQEFGRAVRKYLDDVKEGTVFQNSSVEIDTVINQSIDRFKKALEEDITASKEWVEKNILSKLKGDDDEQSTK